MEYSNLWNEVNYRSPLPYIVNSSIREYDLSKANISSLHHFNVLSDQEYEYFLNLPKKDREVKIGLMIRKDNSIYKHIKKGIEYARHCLMKYNEIQTCEIVSIKNDAVFVYGRDLQHTQFDEFKFAVKNVFKTYMWLGGNIEVYYNDYEENGDILSSITIKGISDANIELHNDGILSIINQVCYMIDRYSIGDILAYVSDMYNEFKNRNLPVPFYRGFDSGSKYSIRTGYFAYLLDYADDSMRSVTDLSVNDSIFRNLLRIVYDIYNSRYGR